MEVTREIELPSPPGDVWEALTDPRRLEEWFATEVELVPEPGGRGVFRWADGEERHAVVEEVVPERRFAFVWGEDESRVEIELEAIEDGTRVTVTEAPSAGWGSAFALHAMLQSACVAA
jgi:uncharacterized protein YndB with AHSA1/START domain